MIRSTAAAFTGVGVVVVGGTMTGRGAAVVGGVDGPVVGGDEPAPGTVKRCPGWMTLASVSRLAASRAAMLTPWRRAMPYSESPGRTVYVLAVAVGPGAAAPGIVKRCPGWMTLASVSRLAASRAAMVTPCLRAMPYSESPGRTVYVLAVAVGPGAAAPGIVKRCPGWMTLASVSRLAASRAAMVTPWLRAMPYSESPGRTV